MRSNGKTFFSTHPKGFHNKNMRYSIPRYGVNGNSLGSCPKNSGSNPLAAIHLFLELSRNPKVQVFRRKEKIPERGVFRSPIHSFFSFFRASLTILMSFLFFLETLLRRVAQKKEKFILSSGVLDAAKVVGKTLGIVFFFSLGIFLVVWFCFETTNDTQTQVQLSPYLEKIVQGRVVGCLCSFFFGTYYFLVRSMIVPVTLADQAIDSVLDQRECHMEQAPNGGGGPLVQGGFGGHGGHGGQDHLLRPPTPMPRCRPDVARVRLEHKYLVIPIDPTWSSALQSLMEALRELWPRFTYSQTVEGNTLNRILNREDSVQIVPGRDSMQFIRGHVNVEERNAMIAARVNNQKSEAAVGWRLFGSWTHNLLEPEEPITKVLDPTCTKNMYEQLDELYRGSDWAPLMDWDLSVPLSQEQYNYVLDLVPPLQMLGYGFSPLREKLNFLFHEHARWKEGTCLDWRGDEDSTIYIAVILWCLQEKTHPIHLIEEENWTSRNVQEILTLAIKFSITNDMEYALEYQDDVGDVTLVLETIERNRSKPIAVLWESLTDEQRFVYRLHPDAPVR